MEAALLWKRLTFINGYNTALSCANIRAVGTFANQITAGGKFQEITEIEAAIGVPADRRR